MPLAEWFESSVDTEAEILDGHLEVIITISEEDQVPAMQRTDPRLKTIVDVL